MAGGRASTPWSTRAFQPCTGAPWNRFSNPGAPLRPEPFFSGPGIDRADPVRGDEARLAEMVASENGLQLLWREGLPAVGKNGRLEWQAVQSSDLFLGIQDSQLRFSAMEQPH